MPSISIVASANLVFALSPALGAFPKPGDQTSELAIEKLLSGRAHPFPFRNGRG